MATLALVVTAAALVWLASEAHYRNCVERATSLKGYSIAVMSGGPRSLARSTQAGAIATPTREAVAAISGCSRLPF